MDQHNTQSSLAQVKPKTGVLNGRHCLPSLLTQKDRSRILWPPSFHGFQEGEREGGKSHSHLSLSLPILWAEFSHMAMPNCKGARKCEPARAWEEAASPEQAVNSYHPASWDHWILRKESLAAPDCNGAWHHVGTRSVTTLVLINNKNIFDLSKQCIFEDSAHLTKEVPPGAP